MKYQIRQSILLALLLFSFQSAYATITIINQPAPVALECDGDGLSTTEFEAAVEAYLDPANNNVTTDCDPSDIYYSYYPGDIYDNQECSNFTVSVQIEDDCTSGAGIYIEFPIIFSDTEPPFVPSWVDQIEYVQCGSNYANNPDNWISSIDNSFNDECMYDHNQIIVENDYNGNPAICGETLDIIFTVTDHCNNSAQYTFSLVVDNDIDGDGLDASVDNCPDDYNPGQEDTTAMELVIPAIPKMPLAKSQKYKATSI